MKLHTLRTAAATSLGAAALAATFVAAPQAQAADPVYWQFKANSDGKCLGSNLYDDVYVTNCAYANNQMWDFVTNYSNGYNVMKNRFTGRCLVTDHKAGGPNAVWTTACGDKTGMHFHFDGGGQQFTTEFGTHLTAESDGDVRAGAEITYWQGWTVQ